MPDDSLRYWDTNCFLGWINKEANKYGDCKDVLKAAEIEGDT